MDVGGQHWGSCPPHSRLKVSPAVSLVSPSPSLSHPHLLLHQRGGCTRCGNVIIINTSGKRALWASRGQALWTQRCRCGYRDSTSLPCVAHAGREKQQVIDKPQAVVVVSWAGTLK